MHATKESLLNALKTVADEQGPDVTLFQFRELTGISRHVVADRWGNWTTLRTAAGLPVRPRLKPVYSDEQLLAEYHQTAVQLDDFPTQSEFSRLSDRSWLTLERRFGHSAEVQAEYRQWLTKQPREAQPKFLRDCPEGCVPSIVPGLYVYEPKPGRFFNILAWLLLSLVGFGGSATPLPALAEVDRPLREDSHNKVPQAEGPRKNPLVKAGFDADHQHLSAGRISDPAPGAPSGWMDRDSTHSQLRGLAPEHADGVLRGSGGLWWEVLPERRTNGCPSELRPGDAPQRLRQTAGYQTSQRQPAGQRFSSSWKQSLVRGQNSQREVRGPSKRDRTFNEKINPAIFTGLLESLQLAQRLCGFYQVYEPGLFAPPLEPNCGPARFWGIIESNRRHYRLVKGSSPSKISNDRHGRPVASPPEIFQTGRAGERVFALAHAEVQDMPNLKATSPLWIPLGSGFFVSENSSTLALCSFLTVLRASHDA